MWSFVADEELVRNLSQFAKWKRTARSDPTELSTDDLDEMMNVGFVGTSMSIKFGMTEGKKKIERWFDCMCVFADEESLAIVGTDGASFVWTRSLVERDLKEGIFKKYD